MWLGSHTFNRPKQRQRNVQNVCCTSKFIVNFFGNEIYWFCCRPHCRRRLAQLHDFINCLEWFSFECRKTKTKVITLANHIGHRQYIEPIKTRSNYMWLTQSAGKSCERVTIGFGFTSDWMKRWRESFKPIASCRKCKTNYFSTLKWKPLYKYLGCELRF